MSLRVWSLRRCFMIVFIFLAAALIWTGLNHGKVSLASSNNVYITEVNEIDLGQLGLVDAAGFLSPNSSDFQIISYNNRLNSTKVSTVYLYGSGTSGSADIAGNNLDPINIAYDGKNDRLLVIDASGQRIDAISTDNGSINPYNLNSFDIQGWHLDTPRGLAINPKNGEIFILDQTGPRIIKITPVINERLDRADVEIIDLRDLGFKQPQGLAVDESTGNLYILDRADKLLYEITPGAHVVSVRDLAAFQLIDPQTITIAPSLDQTDEEDTTSLYIVDRQHKMKNRATREASILEMSLLGPRTMVMADTYTSNLINTIDTSQFLPPCPDPCGVEYIAGSNSLMIVDSEVEEMTIWAGSNLYESSLSGELLNTGSTTSFTPEPTGIAYNPTNQHYFLSDDRYSARKVWEVATGADGLLGTSDDSRTSFSMASLGSNDPEGVAYDPETNSVFVVDGVNREVYTIKPGQDGLFNGIGDIVSQFDTEVLGVLDPEGIGFNPANDHVYIGGNKIGETTIAGDLVQMIDISGIRLGHLGGLGCGVSSTDPNAMSLYIADRVVDNNDDPAENDGKIYELSLPHVTENYPPVVLISSPPSFSSFGEGQSIEFAGTATDFEEGDLGNNLVWSSSIDGQIGTGKSFAISSLSLGTHTITAAVTDSQGLLGIAQRRVTVTAVNQAPVVAITHPDNGASITFGENLTFSGSATDEDGDLSDNLVWSSSIDGQIGTGKTFATPSLSIGTHTITAAVFDNQGLEGSSQVTITVEQNQAPVVTITSPENGARFTYGESITFSGSATDEDGDLSANIIWTSSRDGQIGNGSTLAISDLSIGSHTITAMVTDSKEMKGSDQVVVTIEAANQAPVVGITSPTDGTSYSKGQSISFKGSATDEDGNLSANLVWTSSRDGQIGKGSTFAVSSLSAGTHTITAAVKDSQNTQGSDQITITVKPTVTIKRFRANNDTFVTRRNPSLTSGSSVTIESNKTASDTRTIYLKFTVSGLTGTVRSAKLMLWATINAPSGGSVYSVSNFYKGTSTNWIESRLCWNNAPLLPGTALCSTGSVAAKTWVEFDLTAAIDGNGTYSFALLNDSYQLAKYYSDEANATYRPSLEIQVEN